MDPEASVSDVSSNRTDPCCLESAFFAETEFLESRQSSFDGGAKLQFEFLAPKKSRRRKKVLGGNIFWSLNLNRTLSWGCKSLTRCFYRMIHRLVGPGAVKPKRRYRILQGLHRTGALAQGQCSTCLNTAHCQRCLWLTALLRALLIPHPSILTCDRNKFLYIENWSGQFGVGPITQQCRSAFFCLSVISG